MKRQPKSRDLQPLPPFLKLTPERRAKIAEQQAELRAQAQARGRLTPEARRMQIAIAHETSARTDVEMLTAEVRDDSTNKEKIERLRHGRSRLAEALAQQGRYDDAADVEPDKDKQTLYQTMWEAVWGDDEATCPCKPFNDGNVMLTHDHVAEDVISPKHGHKLMPAIRCNQCGFINVRPLTHELRMRERSRNQAQAVIHGHDPRQLRHGAAAMLTDANLHDHKLLRK